MAADIIPIVNQPIYQETTVVSQVVDDTLLYTLKTLIKKYKKRMGDTDDFCVVSGGLQQFINKQEKKMSVGDQNKRGLNVNDLPVSLKRIA